MQSHFTAAAQLSVLYQGGLVWYFEQHEIRTLETYYPLKELQLFTEESAPCESEEGNLIILYP